jgi:hypothetical protein
MTLPNEPEEQPAKIHFTPAKLIAISAILAILGFGLCASGFSVGDNDSWRMTIGSSGFYIGMLGITIGAIWWTMIPRKK